MPHQVAKALDSEKITINLGYVDLGNVDLLVREGFYSNQTDFIRAAIRSQLERHEEAARAFTRRRQLQLAFAISQFAIWKRRAMLARCWTSAY